MVLYCGKCSVFYSLPCRKGGGPCIVANVFPDFFKKKIFLINFLFFEFIFKLVAYFFSIFHFFNYLNHVTQ